MFPMSRIAIALQEKGHEVHVVSMQCAKAGGVPKIYDGTGVTVHFTASEGNLEYDDIISGPSMINGVNNFDYWVSSW